MAVSTQLRSHAHTSNGVVEERFGAAVLSSLCVQLQQQLSLTGTDLSF